MLSLGVGTVTVRDLLIAVLVVWLMAAVRGRLAIAFAVLLAFWGLAIAGVIAIQGVPVSALIVLASGAGLMVQILTGRAA